MDGCTVNGKLKITSHDAQGRELSKHVCCRLCRALLKKKKVFSSVRTGCAQISFGRSRLLVSAKSPQSLPRGLFLAPVSYNSGIRSSIRSSTILFFLILYNTLCADENCLLSPFFSTLNLSHRDPLSLWETWPLVLLLD